MPENELCFIDSNIWLYALIEQDKEKTKLAKTLIETSALVVSTQVISEVCVNLLRKANATETQIGQLVEAFYRKYPVVEVDKSILLSASQLRERYLFSYWDSIIVASALVADAIILYSEDMQEGLDISFIEDTNKKLKIVNPFLHS